MTNRYLFLLSAVVTVCISLADAILYATLPCEGERALASMQTVAVLENDCLLSGVVAEKDSNVYAEFEVKNPGDKKTDITFYYSVQCMPAMSPMSRMMPLPRVATNGCYRLSVEGHRDVVERIMIPPDSTAGTASGSATNAQGVASKQWILSVSGVPVTSGPVWGGVPPVTALATNKLGNGVLILARTPITPINEIPAKR